MISTFAKHRILSLSCPPQPSDLTCNHCSTLLPHPGIQQCYRHYVAVGSLP